MKVDNFAKGWHLERLRAICEFSSRSPQHEPPYRIDEAALGKREEVLAKRARANVVGREKQK